MKNNFQNLWTGYNGRCSFFSLSFYGLLFGILMIGGLTFSIKSAKASDISSIEATACSPQWVDNSILSPQYTWFVAQNNNLSKVQVYSGQITDTNVSFTILIKLHDSPYTTIGSQNYTSISYGPYAPLDFVFTSPLPLTIGTKYDIVISSDKSFNWLYCTQFTAACYPATCGGTGVAIYYYFIAYYSDTYVAEYCDDGVCNNGETVATCEVDCPPNLSTIKVIWPANPYNELWLFDQPVGTGSPQSLSYDYLTDGSISTSTDYIRVYLCDDYVVGDPYLCTYLTPVILWDWETSATTTHLKIFKNSPYSYGFGKSYFTMYDPVNSQNLGTTTELLKHYKVQPFWDLTGTPKEGQDIVMTVYWHKTTATSSDIVFWSATTSVPQLYPCVDPYVNTGDICDGIDTGGVLGQIHCGVKSAVVNGAIFLLSPSCESINNFKNNFDTFKRAFPFNSFFQITDSIQTAIDSASSSTSTTQNFSVPFIHKATTTFYMLPIISSSSLSNTIGVQNANTFRLTLIFIIWLVTATIIYFTVRKI